VLRKGVARPLPPGYDLATHFTPSYEPWDQRMCLVPDGDFFAAISSGQADVVTGHIEAFTRTGIRLRSGEHRDAAEPAAAAGRPGPWRLRQHYFKDAALFRGPGGEQDLEFRAAPRLIPSAS
jgi:cation diffusion facilitator CzcD-associated flavoprotein CzcO